MLKGVSAQARCLAYLLPLACDDAGRAKMDLKVLAELLMRDVEGVDAKFAEWFDDLERVGWVVRYLVGDELYFRLATWHLHQRVDRPTPSRLPPSPTEAIDDLTTRELASREAMTRQLQGRAGNGKGYQGVGDEPSETRESTIFSDKAALATAAQAEAANVMKRIGDKAEDEGQYGPAIRAHIARARFLGAEAGLRATAATPRTTAPPTSTAAPHAAEDAGADTDAYAGKEKPLSLTEWHGVAPTDGES